MRILFIHQNFPGQFKHLAPELVKRGHEVRALKLQNDSESLWNGVQIHGYRPMRSSTQGVHPWISDFETKTIRAEAVFHLALKLKDQGFDPEVIISHPGWGESMFLKEVWPNAKLGIYCEFFYHQHGADVGFDPEFPVTDAGDVCRLQLKNLNYEKHILLADGAIAPTHWQASTFPSGFREKISVIHDGIDTEVIKPKENVFLELQTQGKKHTLTRQDEVITFVNRNLEPYRGYHIFMRALPSLLKQRPNATVLMIGGDDISYGARSPSGRSWKEIFLDEVKDQISKEDLSRVKFLGNIPYEHFVPILQLSRLHIYLTYPFVLSWSLLEAMSAGCTILASNTAPLREAIVHNETGCLVDFFDVDSLVSEAVRLLSDAAERDRLGSNARAFAMRNYDLQTVCLPKQLEWVEHLSMSESVRTSG